MTLGKHVNLFQIARDTHGSVRADLSQLCLEAALQYTRTHVDDMDVDSEDHLPEESLNQLIVEDENFVHVLGVSGPSTLRENKVEVPDIQWQDIAGLEKIKRELQEMVRYPIEHRGLFEKIGT